MVLWISRARFQQSRLEIIIRHKELKLNKKRKRSVENIFFVRALVDTAPSLFPFYFSLMVVCESFEFRFDKGQQSVCLGSVQRHKRLGNLERIEKRSRKTDGR